eukprot:COSAG03_NODE_3073_length_2248_cov_2.164728_2_plen_253_part_00
MQVVPHGEDVVDVIDQGWWGSPPAAVTSQCEPRANNTWCHCVEVGNRSGTQLGVPHEFTTAGHAGNNGATFYLNRTHVVQMQPLYRCAPGAPILALWHGPSEMASDHHVQSLWGDGTFGAHGGSGLSSLGGQIRLGELNESAPPISHALSFELFAHLWYYCRDHTNRSSCFRWPATTADGYACEPTSPLVYGGTNENLTVGSLLVRSPTGPERSRSVLVSPSLALLLSVSNGRVWKLLRQFRRTASRVCAAS